MGSNTKKYNREYYHKNQKKRLLQKTNQLKRDNAIKRRLALKKIAKRLEEKEIDEQSAFFLTRTALLKGDKCVRTIPAKVKNRVELMITHLEKATPKLGKTDLKFKNEIIARLRAIRIVILRWVETQEKLYGLESLKFEKRNRKKSAKFRST